MAFLLVIAIVSFWWMAGWALLNLAGVQRNLLRAVLLAPAAGVAAFLIPLFELYRLGVPVLVGGPIATALVAAAAGVWAIKNRRRMLPPWSLLWRTAAALIWGAGFVGAPLLTEGFAWVSFCNDDMANYVLGAQGLLERGYLAPYSEAAYVANADPSLQLTAVLEAAGLRCGAELLLAWVMALTGFVDHRVFMPVIIALQVALIGAVAGLVCTGRQRRKAAWVVVLWCPTVALVVLGAVYQLIAQVLGLGLVAVTAAILLDRRAQRRATAMLGGVLSGALGISYPEVMPFLVLGTLLYYGKGLLRSWRWFGEISLVAILLWNTFAIAILNFFVIQVKVGAKGSEAQQFPYYLIPSGFPTFWGLIPVAGRLEGIWMDIAIACGALLMVAGGYAIGRQYRRGEPVGAVALSFALIMVLLFARGVDFGTYKAAMYLWPFLSGVVVLTAGEWLRWPRARALAWVMAMAGLLAVPTSWGYIAASAGWTQRGSGFVEIPKATESRLLDHLRRLAEQPREGVLIADTHNVVLAKFAGTFFRGESFRTPSKNFFSTSGRYFGTQFTNWFAELRRPGYQDAFTHALQERTARFRDASFPLPDGGSNPFQAEQPAGEEQLPARYTLLRSGPDLTVLNRSSAAPATGPLSLLPGDSVKNHLILTESYLGYNYYLARAARSEGRVALFQLEPDYFRKGRTLSSAGRHLLLEVLGPVADSQMRLEVTSSLNNDGENRVPPAAVLAGRKFSLGAVGRGSARLQAPVEPLILDRQSFLLLDMGVAARRFPEERRGLLAWFGRTIPLDNRKITSFVRDISLVTAEPEAPAFLPDLRAGLENPALLYSGAYEDGWVAEESFFRLQQPAGQVELMVRVNVPDVVNRPTSFTLRVDNEEPNATPLAAGLKEIRIPVQAVSVGTPRRVQLRFDRATALSAQDRRPASAQISAIGFQKRPESKEKKAEIPLAGVSLGAQWHPYEEFGGAQFRWVERNAEVIVNSTAAGRGKLTLELEAGPGVGSKAFQLLVVDDSGKTVGLPCHGGRDRYVVELAVKPGRNRFRLSVAGGGLPTPNDPRVLNFRVFSVGWARAGG